MCVIVLPRGALFDSFQRAISAPHKNLTVQLSLIEFDRVILKFPLKGLSLSSLNMCNSFTLYNGSSLTFHTLSY